MGWFDYNETIVFNMTLIYFIYGLAFFSMGLTLLFETRRSPLVAEAGVLRPLVVFGFLHGGHEWLEMFLDKSDWFIFIHPLALAWGRVALLAVSFLALLIFGLFMLRPFDLFRSGAQGDGRRPKPLWWQRWVGLSAYVAGVMVIALLLYPTHADRLTHIDATIRYLLALPGAALAGVALWKQAALARRRGLVWMGRALRMAGVSFLLYGLTQAVVPPLHDAPNLWLNTVSFAAVFGFPVQLLRAAAAVLITYSLVRTVQAAEDERREQFQRLERERLDALEQVQAELLQREAMRQELMRSIVLAQEGERARVARELHDETAQTLTAFSLHLAALRSKTDGELRSELELLQGLCKQMSQDIYRLVRDLRPAQLDDLGLAPALSYLVDESQPRLGLKIDLQIGGPRRRLPPLVETVLFRVAQEALTNVARHAQVKAALVRLDFGPEQVVLQVKDQGQGFDVNQAWEYNQGSGLGLVGMRQRVDSVHGSLRIISAPQEGASVEVRIPLDGWADMPGSEKLESV